MHNSLDQLEDWACSEEGLLDSPLEPPNKKLLRWQDGAKMICLKQKRLSGMLTENNQDAIYLTNKICELIRECYEQLDHLNTLPKTSAQAGAVS